MLFSTDVRDDIAKWAKAHDIDANEIVAYEQGQSPNLGKPGFTYTPITIPVAVPGMKFYRKVATAKPSGLPNFGKLDPAPPKPSVDPKPKLKPISEVLPPKAKQDPATHKSVEPKSPTPKPEPPPQPAPKPKFSSFSRKGDKK